MSMTFVRAKKITFRLSAITRLKVIILTHFDWKPAICQTILTEKIYGVSE